MGNKLRYQRRRVDDNQAEIVEALRAIGATVTHLHANGHGCPDLLVGWQGVNVLMEVKQPKGRLNTRQARWHRQWAGQVCVVTSSQEAWDVLADIVPADDSAEPGY